MAKVASIRVGGQHRLAALLISYRAGDDFATFEKPAKRYIRDVGSPLLLGNLVTSLGQVGKPTPGCACRLRELRTGLCRSPFRQSRNSRHRPRSARTFRSCWRHRTPRQARRAGIRRGCRLRYIGQAPSGAPSCAARCYFPPESTAARVEPRQAELHCPRGEVGGAPEHWGQERQTGTQERE